MAITYYSDNVADVTDPAAVCNTTQLYIVVDTDAEKPTANLRKGWLCFVKDPGTLYKATGVSTWTEVGAGAPGSFSISQTEVDFGATPVTEGSFTVTNASVTAAMKLIGNVAYVAPTGRDLDEVEMEPFQLTFVAGSGNFTVFIQSTEGPVEGKYKIHYTFA